jgi:hypothetical protein
MNLKKYIIITVIVAVVLIVSVSFYFASRNKEIQPTQNIISPAEQAAVILEEENKYEQQMKSLDATLDKARELDTDLDGLTNEEEKKLGTDPNRVDTDKDGLVDSSELKDYLTDPLKADTDGDGFFDGVEVRGKYNPLGPGKLIK